VISNIGRLVNDDAYQMRQSDTGKINKVDLIIPERLAHFWVDESVAQTIRSGCNDVCQIQLEPTENFDLLGTQRSILVQSFERARHAS
jgi:hypothetical protein